MAPPIHRLVDRILYAYDANRNGVIERKKEDTYTHTSSYPLRDRLVTSTITLSHAKLFRAADANRDGRVPMGNEVPGAAIAHGIAEAGAVGGQ